MLPRFSFAMRIIQVLWCANALKFTERRLIMRTKWIFITAIAAVVGLHGIVAQASLLYKVEHPTEPTRQRIL